MTSQPTSSGNSPNQLGQRPLELGVVVMPIDNWTDTLQRAQQIEAMGFDHYWLYDHHSWRHYRDQTWHSTVPWLAAVAAGTSSIGIGTMVSSPNMRHPATMAKDAMTLDHLSDGRFILGLGAGTTGFDATVFGDDPLDARQRADRFIEYTDVVDRMLTGETDHTGTWYTVNEGRIVPGCVQQPRLPLAIAAGGPRTLKMATEKADILITLGIPSQPAETLDDFIAQLASQAESVDQHCAIIGREPGSLRRLAFLSAGRSEPMQSFDAFVDFAGRIQKLGYDSIVVHDRVATDPALNFDPGLIGQLSEWDRTL